MITSVIMMGCSKTKGSNDIIASVNDNEITMEYYEKTLNLQKLAIENSLGKEIWEKDKNYKEDFKNEVLDQIIKIYAICDEAKENDLIASEKEINIRFEEVKSAINSDEDYKKQIDKLGIDDEYIKNQQEQDIILAKYEEYYLNLVRVSDKEAEEYYDKNKDIQESDFEQVRDYIKMEIKKEKFTKKIDEIVKKSNINKNDDLLKKIKI